MFVASITPRPKRLSLGKARACCGQAVVEYILIVAAITGAIVAMKGQMMRPLMGVLDDQAKKSLSASVDRGTRHYSNGCSTVDGGGLCN
jgi:hypothetical protein